MTEFVYSPPDQPLSVIHEDRDFVIVDKPAGLLSVPGRGEDRADCLITRLRAVWPEILLVHRLDLDTSGVMVFARNKSAQGAISQQFEKRVVDKQYVARLAGLVGPDQGRVDLPLIVDWPNRPRQHVNHETGRPARTDWQVIARGQEETRMRLIPLTGRSHQLRVHMAALGHPILGDTLYATGDAMDHPRLMLHAETLALRHPRTDAALSFTAPLPF
ncbi:RluA family pseudouridine synthase [Szabonella alba]|uniref:Dual-specificity RNA pseudouridine synthase RluA n=1 Tax=Szabonella alba TaxID=2804194 RepID=A0A8K0VET3_9RHOB|nr:pseudouridine synthase [Szabonella alba]MBL4918470.1 RNA pseudouridine synthase [Szabonella alba]